MNHTFLLNRSETPGGPAVPHTPCFPEHNTALSFMHRLPRFCWLLAICLTCLYGLPAAASPQDAWQKGNTYYQQKEYDSAARYFEEIAANKPADPTIFYNLGNTYYRLNKIGLAVLNYERALKRKPDYKEAADNLLLAQSRIPNRIQSTPDIFFVQWWKSLTAPTHIILWSVLSLLFFITWIGLLFYRKMTGKGRGIPPQVMGSLIILWLLCMFLSLSSAKASISNQNGVIITPNTPISNNDRTGKWAGMLPEGTTVHIVATRGDQYEVALPDSRTGWIARNSLQLID